MQHDWERWKSKHGEFATQNPNQQKEPRGIEYEKWRIKTCGQQVRRWRGELAGAQAGISCSSTQLGNGNASLSSADDPTNCWRRAQLWTGAKRSQVSAKRFCKTWNGWEKALIARKVKTTQKYVCACVCRVEKRCIAYEKLQV